MNTIALNPAGTLLVSGCKDGTATIWDTGGHSTLQQVHCHSGTVHHMAFSPGTSQASQDAAFTCSRMKPTFNRFLVLSQVGNVRHKLPAH